MKSYPLGLVARGALVLGLASLLPVSASAVSRIVTAPVEGLRDASPRVHALVGGRIVTAPGQIIEQGTLVLRDGLIESVGAGVTAPADARVWDVTGRILYAGFIESHSSLYLPESFKPVPPRAPDAPPGAAPAAARAEPAPATGARAWNSRVMPERSAALALTPDPKSAEKLRGLGFTLANIAPARGLFRGRSALVSTGTANFNVGVVRPDIAQEVAFEFGSFIDRTYPTSLMGAVALVRQTLLDAQWYAATQAAYTVGSGLGAERPEANDSLAALGPLVRGEQLMMFELVDELDVARVLKLGEEFKLRVAFRGAGTEYRMRDLLAKAKTPVVLALDFPDVPEVELPDKAVEVSLHELQQWETAPANAARLAEAGVPVAFTSARLKKPETEFWPRLRQTVTRGLAADRALAALTTTPAALLGVADTHGTLEKGKAANVVVANGDLFKSEDAAIELLWVDGEPFELEDWQRLDARGTWKFTWSGPPGPGEIVINGAKPNRLKAKAGDKDIAASLPDKNTVLLFLPAELFGATGGTTRLVAGGKGDRLTGTGELPDGTALRWTAQRTAPAKPEAAANAKPAAEEKFLATTDVYPAGAYGRKNLPTQPEHILIRNGTLWTSGAAGIIEGGDVLITRGKIEKVGKNLTAPAGAVVIDATGQHVTAGLIDCHSHTAMSRGVNEGASSVTVEVRVADVIDPTDIGIYRQLAGGLTTANVLHGSANAMGGQNQVIKLRWGAGAEELKFAGAKPGVKFALGENVVRASATGPRTRYPMSRMGVPEIMLDTFNRAREYGHAWSTYRAGSGLLPRRDLRLEAALEILNGERLVHIHSYRQDEILAFIRLAEQLQLKVGTFQHILEGYKVAPEIAKLGAGGSSFSDWWAYKYEVIDAIPYNGALMSAAGVVVSFNSDSDELARRLNTEAAKAVKYGGVSPAEAWKFVTLNPAKQLKIDDRVGSLEPGKDADFVLWNASPLSTRARPNQTWIDGRRYFDRDEDKLLRTAAAAERAALLQKALAARQKVLTRSGGGGGDGPPAEPAYVMAQADNHDEFRAIYHHGGNDHTCSLEEGGHQ